jgi:C-terminal processing protease CtpA/Prc
MRYILAGLIALSVLVWCGGVRAEVMSKLDGAARTRAIEGVLRCLREGYVFPEVAQKMEKAVRERAASGAYDRIEAGPELAAELTRDLQAASRDKHVRVNYLPEMLPVETAPSITEPPALSAMEQRAMARDNFGLAKLDILKGNIGYLDFRYLAPPSAAGDTYVAAMNYVAHTEALILDLRRCSGAISPDAIPLLCSYFFAAPTHLNDIYWRPTNSTRQFWTSAQVSGKRYLDKPIYVLTSRSTFSGAEELAYDLKNLKRATLVGETTGGGAHGGGDQRADDHFMVWVPYGRAINPLTKTNWEGTGVQPDVQVPAVLALHRAQTLALKQFLAVADDAPWKDLLTATIAEVERSTPKLKQVTFALKGFPDAKEVFVAGTFNSWAPEATPLARKGDVWIAEVDAEAGRHAYKFIVDGRWITDPDNPETEQDREFVNSVRTIR